MNSFDVKKVISLAADLEKLKINPAFEIPNIFEKWILKKVYIQMICIKFENEILIIICYYALKWEEIAQKKWRLFLNFI